MDMGDLDMGFDWSMVKILCNVSATLPDFPTNVPQQVNEPNVKTITFILSCSIFWVNYAISTNNREKYFLILESKE